MLLFVIIPIFFYFWNHFRSGEHRLMLAKWQQMSIIITLTTKYNETSFYYSFGGIYCCPIFS